MYQDVKKSMVLKDGTLKLTGTMKQPGFYRVDVTAHVEGKDYKAACAGRVLTGKVTTVYGYAKGLFRILAECDKRGSKGRLEPHQAPFARALHQGCERLRGLVPEYAAGLSYLWYPLRSRKGG